MLGGGAIYDLGCYPLTAVLLFFRIGKKNNNIKNYKFDSDIGRYGVDENAKANLIFECGGKAEINVSIRKNLQNIIEIFGSKGKIKILNPWIPQRNSKIELEIKGKKMLIENFLKKDIYALELDKASIAIINNKKEIDFPGATLRSSLEYIKIIDKWKS